MRITTVEIGNFLDVQIFGHLRPAFNVREVRAMAETHASHLFLWSPDGTPAFRHFGGRMDRRLRPAGTGAPVSPETFADQMTESFVKLAESTLLRGSDPELPEETRKELREVLALALRRIVLAAIEAVIRRQKKTAPQRTLFD